MTSWLARPGTARGWHALTAAVALGALFLQLALIISGAAVLVEAAAAPSTPVRVFRFVTYFTVQSNLLVLVTTAALARDPGRDGRVWRVVRLDAVLGIAVTGLIHWFFLRPLLHLQGWSLVADKLLHLAVPLLAVIGWVAFGPRHRIARDTIGLALLWPAAYMVFTVIHGSLAGFYPYPFTNVQQHGYLKIGVNAIAISVLFLLLAFALHALDARLRIGSFDEHNDGLVQQTNAAQPRASGDTSQ